MNLKNLLFVSLAILSVLTASAASVFKADNATSLDQPGSWVGGIAPGTGDLAAWDATVTTPANCTNTLNADTGWGGIEILNPATTVEIDGGSTLFLGSSGIDLNEAGTSQSLFLNLPVNISADQSWNIASGQTLTFANNDVITSNNTVTVNGDVSWQQGCNVGGGGVLNIEGGTFLMETNFLTSHPLEVGSDGAGGTINQDGGAVILGTGDGTSGSYQDSLRIGEASGGVVPSVYNLNGGSLIDDSLTTYTICTVGNANGTTGILNINGGNAQFYSLRIGNNGGVGFVNVTNGTLTVIQGEFSIGRGSASGTQGTFNEYGGTVSAPGIDVNVSHENPGTLNIYGGAFNVGGNLVVPQKASANGTVTITGGELNVTNNVELPGGGGGTGTVNLNGGILSCESVTVTSGGASALELNGGTLMARQSTVNFIASDPLLTAHVDAGGAIIDTAGHDVTIPAVLLNGTGGGADGGLTKIGDGSLTLSGANTYNGPTIAGGGTLVLNTTNSTVSALTVSNTATLDAILGTAGSSLNCASFNDSLNPGDSVINQFDLGAFGNPSTPVINAASLTVNGTVHVVVNGSGFAIGTIPLIKYSGTLGGSGTFVLDLLTGAAGYITNDTSTKTISVVVTGFPQFTWRAQVNNDWDFTNANWVDVHNNATHYVDGASTLFDDSASNTSVNVTGVFNPAGVNLSNVNSNYVFSGVGSIAGTAALTKTGAGSVFMALTNNSYSGDTLISGGVFQVGAPGAIPSGTGEGNVTLEGKLDLAGFNLGLNGLNGNNGMVDNSSLTSVTLSVGNGGASGSFGGTIMDSGAPLSLNVTGGGITLLATNTYSGGTADSAPLVLAAPQSIGSGPLTLHGGTLAWANSSAHTLTNAVTISSSSTFGTTGNGPLTVQNTVNLNGNTIHLTCNNDVLFANGMTNGSPSVKDGPATLTVDNTSTTWSGSMQVKDGLLALNNDSIIQNSGNVRVQCTADSGLSELTVNGGSYTLSNGPGANLRVGASDTSGGSGCTNILDVAATVAEIPYPGGSGGLLMMGGSQHSQDAEDIVNLLPGGVLQVRAVTSTAVSPTVTTFNFNGGTLQVSTNDYSGSFFDPNIFSVNVLDGGGTIDTAGYNVTFANDLLAGGTGIGGFTKAGGGQLVLAGTGYSPSTYGGATVVNGGTLVVQVSIPDSTNFTVAAGATLDVSYNGLEVASGKSIGGSGIVVGTVTVDSGATVTPGVGASLGTLTFNSAPTLNGAVLLRLNAGGSPANDQLAAPGNTLNYGGALVVTNVGTVPSSGSKFYLFSASGYSGSFSSVTLPSLPAGLGWTNNLLGDGSITITGTVVTPNIPEFNSLKLVNGSLVMSGTNGTASTSYRVLSSTNLALSVTNWTAVATNSFDARGNFIFTNTVNSTTPARFFDIVSP
jgi:fibronectin-binding autotransporter adhesin